MSDKKQNNLNLDISPEVAEGTYSNLVVITHSPSEFIIDFAQTMPGTNNPTIRERIVLAPMHCKRFLNALKENIDRYENQFGMITEPGRRDDGTVPYDILGKA